jgi:hypothetical protein
MNEYDFEVVEELSPILKKVHLHYHTSHFAKSQSALSLFIVVPFTLLASLLLAYQFRLGYFQFFDFSKYTSTGLVLGLALNFFFLYRIYSFSKTSRRICDKIGTLFCGLTQTHLLLNPYLINEADPQSSHNLIRFWASKKYPFVALRYDQISNVGRKTIKYHSPKGITYINTIQIRTQRGDIFSINESLLEESLQDFIEALFAVKKITYIDIDEKLNQAQNRSPEPNQIGVADGA